VWRGSWDVFFFAASALLPVFFGAALGNLLRGVPLTSEGWFELPLFTDFSARPPVGVLDWYTVSVGVFALAALCATARPSSRGRRTADAGAQPRGGAPPAIASAALCPR
jgi:cytochrome bd-type quinol oxidase subunit 2